MELMLAVLWFMIAGFGFVQSNSVGMAVGCMAAVMGIYRAARWWTKRPTGPASHASGAHGSVMHPEFDLTTPEPEATNPPP